jgi:hypothetical protein
LATRTCAADKEASSLKKEEQETNGLVSGTTQDALDELLVTIAEILGTISAVKLSLK